MSQLHFRERRRQTFFKVNKDKSEEKLWPFISPGVDEIVDSGFYFTPTKKFPDQVTCFWCGKKEKNLEGEESFKTRHLSNNRKCPYSLISLNMDKFVNDKKQETFWQDLIADGAPLEVADPLSHQSIALRRSTFKKLWKFDSRKNAKVSSQSLAEAGFYFSPLEVGNDRVLCMYCDCSLDEWSPDDDPIEEHRVNSPTHCYFLENLARKEKAKQLPLASKPIASPPSPMNVNKRSRTPPNSTEEGFSDDDAYDFSIDQIEDPTAKHVPDIRSLRPRLAVKEENGTLVSKREKTSLVLQVTHGVDNNSSREFDGASQDLNSPDVDDMVLDKGSDANSILSYSDDNYVESYSESSPEKPSELPRSLRLRARNLASKKRQSQFSDDDVEMNLDAILNSPKKDRKIRKLQTRGEPSPGPDFFDDSNHNIGDYSEENIDYLESKVSPKKANTEVTNGELQEEDSKPPKLGFKAVSLPPEVIEVRSSPSPEGAKGKTTANGKVHTVKRSQFSSPEKFEGLFMDTHEPPMKEGAQAAAKSEAALETPSSISDKGDDNLETADLHQQLNSIQTSSDAMPIPDAKEEASIENGNNAENQDHQEDISTKERDIEELTESSVGAVPQNYGLAAETSPDVEMTLPIDATDRTLSNQDSAGDTAANNIEVDEGTTDIQNDGETSTGSQILPGEAKQEDGVNREASEISQEFRTPDVTSALDSNVQEVPENPVEEAKSQDAIPGSQPNVPENNAMLETPTGAEGDPSEVKSAGAASNTTDELNGEQQEIQETTIDLNILVEDEKDQQKRASPKQPKEERSEALKIEAENTQHNEKDNEFSEEIVDDATLPESKTDAFASGVRDSPKRQSLSDQSKSETNLKSLDPVDEVVEPLAVQAQETLDSAKAAPTEIAEESQVLDRGDSIIPDSVSDLAPLTSIPDPVDEAEAASSNVTQEAVEPERPKDAIQRVPEKEELKIVEEHQDPVSAESTAANQLKLSADFSQGDLDASTPRNSGSHHILQDESVTIERNPQQETNPVARIPKIDHLDSALLLSELDVLLDTIAYLAEISATRQELHNDTEGLLTRFIASLPEEEENMTIEEWILHNAKTCGDTVRQIGDKVVAAYEAKYNEIIAHVRALPTLD